MVDQRDPGDEDERFIVGCNIEDRANARQVGGDHYKKAGLTGEEHWDRVARLGFDPFQSNITKYVERWRDKGGLQDLEKARHYLDKYIELVKDGKYQSS